jgi:predicted transcriptional regulator
MSSIDVTELKELFKKNIVMDIDDLMKQTSSSRITVLRNLKELGYTTSYNWNGKYYTLLEIAKFDDSGIFDHKGILFFRDGGIQELVIKEINSSEKGYTAEELRNKIKTRVSNQLHQFVSKGLIIRKKYADFYVYYSIDYIIHQKQISNREKELKIPSTKENSEISSEKKTIRILLEIIQNPNTQPQEIGKILRQEGLKISDSFIQNIFEKYDIQKKGSPSHF